MSLDKHLKTINTPTLIVQGERDPFGGKDEVAQYVLSKRVRVAWIEDGDHSFKPRKSAGVTEEQNWQAGVAKIVTFVDARPGDAKHNQRRERR